MGDQVLPPLYKLSTELIWHVINFIPPSSHLDFACTSKQVLSCSANVLNRHREYHNRYRVSSDWDPRTLPTLLRSALRLDDPLKAWHVRSFEVWHDRTEWNEWKTFSIDQTEDSITSWKFEDDELALYMENLRKHLIDDNENFENALTRMEQGHEGFLKALLIANCPRLDDVKFITLGREQFSSLKFLSTFNLDTTPAPGLHCLKSVGVGIRSGTPFDEEGASEFPYFLNLLTLPNIESISYRGLEAAFDEGDFDITTLLPPKSSSIKHIFLDDCNEMCHDFQDALTQAPKELLTFCFRGGPGADTRNDDVDRLVLWLGEDERQGNTLESLMFYNFNEDNWNIHGYRCNVYRPEELQNFSVLKDVSIDFQDIDLDAFYDCEDQDMARDERMQWWKKWVPYKFPESMETLHLWGQPESGHFFHEDWDFERVEEMVIAMIESEWFQNLRAFYLEEIERNRDGTTRPDKIPFLRAIEIGKQYGIDVHTITNPRAVFHEPRDFPESPDAYDLVTGPHKGVRPEGWTFDIYTGRRRPAGCGGCGACDKCLQQYSKELWDGLRNRDTAGKAAVE